jgi:hypothetical protein
MILNFTIDNKVEFEAKIELSIEELFPNYISLNNDTNNNFHNTKKTFFKIPLNVKN